MFEEEYKAAFSKVTASEDTYRRIMQMTQKPKYTAHKGRFFGKILAAAVIVSLMAVAASAAEEIEDYFYHFFEKDSQVELTDSQMQYVEENTHTFTEVLSATECDDAQAVVPVGPSTVVDGYTLTVDSALADESNAYIQLTLTAPEGKTLDAEDYRFDVGSSLQRDGRWISLLDASGRMRETEPTENAVKMFCAFRLANLRYGSFADGKPVTLVLEKLAEVRKTGATEEVSLLSEGPWHIEFTFRADTATSELIKEPVDCHMQTYREGMDPQVVPEQVDAKLTSLSLMSLGAQIRYELPGPDSRRDSVDIAFMTVVMEDGSTVRLVPRNRNTEERTIGFSANAPILLEKVAHVLLPDGTEILMPE